MPFHRRDTGSGRRQLPALDDVAAGWIRRHRQPFHAFAVCSLVPDAFEDYARILHPAWTRWDEPVRWEAIADWSGKTMHALAQFDPLSRPLDGARGAPPFDRPPDTGGLPPEKLAALGETLAVHTGTPDRCYVGIWDGYGAIEPAETAPAALELDQRTYLIHEASLEAMVHVPRELEDGLLVGEAPTLIWPADRAWFVASDTDLDSTYVGGSERFIAALLEQPGIEGWPVNATDRVTFDSDEINGV